MLGRDHSLSPVSKTVFSLKSWWKVSSRIAWAEPISTQNVGVWVQVEMAQRCICRVGGVVMGGTRQTVPFCHHQSHVCLGKAET